MIEVILKEPVDHLGGRGDVVKVADGYARNYLLPRKLALAVTSGNKRQIDAEKKRALAREAEERSACDDARFAARSGGMRRRAARRREGHALRVGHVV